MSLLDLFHRPSLTDPVFGALTYRRRAWHGAVEIPEYAASPIPLEICTDKDSDLASFRERITQHIRHSAQLKQQIAESAYETYAMYVREDLETGNFVEYDYAEYPTVTSEIDVWNALKPFSFTLTDSDPNYDSLVWLEVLWPNSHYFRACCKGDELYLLDVDG